MKRKAKRKCLTCGTALTKKNTTSANPYICKSCMGFEERICQRCGDGQAWHDSSGRCTACSKC